MYISLTMVDAAHISAPGGRGLALRLDPSAAIVTEYISFPEILRLLYLPIYAGTFIIGRWCRDRLGGSCSWPICNINIFVAVGSGGHQFGLGGASLTYC